MAGVWRNVKRAAFFFDFDDTLFSHATMQVPERARRALFALRSEGHLIVIATGRGPESIRFIQQQAGACFDAIIALNGQLVYQDGKKVFERFITLPSIRTIAAIASEHRFPCGGYYAGGELVDRIDERVEQVWRDFGCPQPDEIPDFPDRWPLYQGHLYVTQEEADLYFCEPLKDYLVNWSHPYLLNLISCQAGKSQGIRWLLKQSGIPKSRAYAFGDGFNDRDMLLCVTHGIAMGNASDELKQAVEFVTATPDDDGIVKALEHYCFL